MGQMTGLIENREQRKQALLQKIVKDIERFLKKHGSVTDIDR